jgi:hypothetical protein
MLQEVRRQHGKEIADMDIARLWQSLRTNPSDAPRAGVLLPAAGSEISISVTQECLIALPPRRSRIPLVSVTVTSNRLGVAGQVTVAANFNSQDGSYQGPTTKVGEGQFTATNSQFQVRFVLLPSGFPVVGVGAVVDYSDGVHGGALTYQKIACNPWVWWHWLTPAVGMLRRPFDARN